MGIQNRVEILSSDFCGNFKGRLVSTGFQKAHELDSCEKYALVVRFTFIRLLLATVAHIDLELHQLDVVTEFLTGDVDEDVYIVSQRIWLEKT